MRARALFAAALLAAAGAAADPEPEAAPPPPEAPAEPGPAPGACDAPAPEAAEIARRAEWALRGDGSELEATLQIARGGRSPRELAFRVWDDAQGDRVLLRIAPPAAGAGSTWLKLPPVLWSFDPKENATRRVPRARWADPWMESEFTLDDLVHGTSARDYAQRLLRVEEQAGAGGRSRAWVIESTPRDPASAGWARLVDWIECEHATLVRRDYEDAKGAVVRTLTLEDARDVAGRRYPHLWVMRAATDPAREARIRVDAVRFPAGFAAGTFSTGSLRPGG